MKMAVLKLTDIMKCDFWFFFWYMIAAAFVIHMYVYMHAAYIKNSNHFNIRTKNKYLN
jgi:hypothetical protein